MQDRVWRSLAIEALHLGALWGPTGAWRRATWHQIEAVLHDEARERREDEEARRNEPPSAEVQEVRQQLLALSQEAAAEWAIADWWEVRRAEIEGQRLVVRRDDRERFGPSGERPPLHPSASELAETLRHAATTGQTLPPDLLTYVAGRLDGSIRPPRGPKPASIDEQWNYALHRGLVRAHVRDWMTVLSDPLRTGDRRFRELFRRIYDRPLPRPSIAATLEILAADILSAHDFPPRTGPYANAAARLIPQVEKEYHLRRDRR